MIKSIGSICNISSVKQVVNIPIKGCVELANFELVVYIQR